MTSQLNLTRGTYRSAEVFRALVDAGWSQRRISGSHYIFSRAGCRSLPVAVHGGKLRRDVVQNVILPPPTMASVPRREGGAGRRVRRRASASAQSAWKQVKGTRLRLQPSKQSNCWRWLRWLQWCLPIATSLEAQSKSWTEMLQMGGSL